MTEVFIVTVQSEVADSAGIPNRYESTQIDAHSDNESLQRCAIKSNIPEREFACLVYTNQIRSTPLRKIGISS
jgi:hypothetical protein